MNKARKKAYKPATIKRLLRESLVLSYTRFASSRVVRFFEKGILSPLFTSAKKVDDFVRDRVTRPLFKKTELHKNVIKPARNAVASALSNNRASIALSRLQSAVLATPLRSFGVFMLTFGIYAAAIFFLKRYISFSIGAADTDDLCVSALMFLVGLLFSAFGDKTIGASFGNSRIIGSLLSESLGVNDSSMERIPKKSSKNAVGVSFLLGSLLGVLTLFFSPLKVFLIAALCVLLFAVMSIPELGLLLTVGTVSFVSVHITAVLSFATLLSYVVKCLRFKRNLRFGTADLAVLVFSLVLLIHFPATNGGFSKGELYILSFTSLYFPTRNLICSKRLVIQTFNAFSVGLTVGMALYLLGVYSAFVPHAHLRAAVRMVTSYTLSADMLAFVASMTVPFLLAMFRAPLGKRSKLFALLLLVACMLVTDSMLFYVLVFVSVLVYVVFAYKAPVGALLGAAIFMIPAASLLSDYTVSAAVTAFKRVTYDATLGSTELSSCSMWDSMLAVGGFVSVLICIVALLLIIQRTASTALMSKSESCVVYSGTVLASGVLATVCSIMFNPFSDLRVLALVWLVWGMGGAVYSVCALNDTTEEV